MKRIETRVLTVNPFSRPGELMKAVKGIVIHWVANPGTSALANRNYFASLAEQKRGNERAVYASAHYIVGLEGEIIQCIPDTEFAYHAGGRNYNAAALHALDSGYPNNCTIGIELCHPDWTGKFEKETLDSARDLCLLLKKKYEFPDENVFRHFDVTGKDCPHYFVKNEDAWHDFKTSILFW